jgi:hypothetical protein
MTHEESRDNQRRSRKTNATMVAQRVRRHLELFPYRSEQRQLLADCREAILQLIEEVAAS